MREMQKMQKQTQKRLQKARPLPAGLGVGAALTARGAQTRLKAERVQTELQRMPGWKLAANGGAIARVRHLGSPAGAADYASFVLRQAARRGQSLGVDVSGSHVALTLYTHSASGGSGGITEALLAFAEALG